MSEYSNNISNKLRVASIIVLWLGWISSFVIFLVYLSNGGLSNIITATISLLVPMLLGFMAWIVSLLLTGLSMLVENTSELVELHYNQNNPKETNSKSQDHPITFDKEYNNLFKG